MKDQGARDKIDRLEGQLEKLAAKMGYYRGVIGQPVDVWVDRKSPSPKPTELEKQNAEMKLQLESVAHQLDGMYSYQNDLYQGLSRLQDDFATLTEFLGLERSAERWRHKEKD